MIKIPFRYIVYLILAVAVSGYVIMRKMGSAKPDQMKHTNEASAKPLSKTTSDQIQSKSKQPSSEDIKGAPKLEDFLRSKESLTKKDIEFAKGQLSYLSVRGQYEDALKLADEAHNRIKDKKLKEEFNIWLEEFKKEYEKRNVAEESYDPVVDQLIEDFEDAQTLTDVYRIANDLEPKALSRPHIKKLITCYWETTSETKKLEIIFIIDGRYSEERYITNFFRDIITKEEVPNLRKFAVSDLGRRDLKKDDYEFLMKLYESDPDPEVREQAYYGLKSSTYIKEDDLISRSLTAEDPIKRKLGIESLDSSDRKTREIILKAVREDRSAVVREAAYEKLIYYYFLPHMSESVIDDEECIKAIINGIVKDPDKEVRSTILGALVDERLSSTKYKGEFRTALEKIIRDDPEWKVRFWAEAVMVELEGFKETDD